MKPKIPTHADRRCNIGLSNIPANFGFILWRKDIMVKEKKNKIEKEMAIAMNIGDVASGAESRKSGASPGSTEKSYWGVTLGAVQLRLAELDAFEHEPNTPKNMLGPSRPWDELELICVNAVDGTTVTSATLSWRRKVGAR